MTPHYLKHRTVRFFHEDGHPVRAVTCATSDGRSYSHLCDVKSFEPVAGAWPRACGPHDPGRSSRSRKRWRLPAITSPWSF